MDLTIYNIISCLTIFPLDWKTEMVEFPPRAGGAIQITQFRGEQPRKDDTTVNVEKLAYMLKKSGNLFADCPLWGYPMQWRLPPRTLVEPKVNSLTIRNPFCSIEFTVESSNTISNEEPGKDLNVVPTLPASAEHRYENRDLLIHIQKTYSGVRANHPEMPHYKAWLDRITEKCKRSFGNQ